MSQRKRLHISMTEREILWGWVYLVFQLTLLPSLLHLVNDSLPTPLPKVWLQLAFFGLNFTAIMLIFHNFLGRSLSQIGKYFGKFIRAVVLGFVLYWVSNLLLSWAITRVFPDFANVNDASMRTLFRENFAVMALGTVILVPVVEETLYRGLVFRALYNRSRTWAYIVSTAVFCAIHVAGYIGQYDPLRLVLCFVQYIPAGVCLAWAYADSDSIFAPIVIHMVINGMGAYAIMR